MQRVFPEEYKKYKTAFEKACWTCDEGCWIGRSVVWKCQVDLHLDGGDGVLGICAILNCGFYVPANASHLGTSAVYPDLNMAFAYLPGEVLMFRSGFLFHAVMPWLPAPQTSGDSLVPGRIAVVFFTPENLLNDLQTAGGQTANRLAFARYDL
ncbi:hypothetical protein SISNIDRAFT_492054 [Sistotremastrum niveocremeum HHB9708]|uniref:Prolyl 4-hydroxylase alpha subunit Fe(2+) 2OG dioxygenase domain-containing protein n=1 Tax=Sistotremastrum niveocremeum HHB9708 TaxID=1314777 RepID=A0A164M413_9AGAM|nr:hypothetical protein SISNIDRAFT_492054 [Sistotremastrum niveocremeum HHB9708]